MGHLLCYDLVSDRKDFFDFRSQKSKGRDEIQLNNDYIIRKVSEVVKRTGTRDPVEICNTLGFSIRFMDLEKRLKAYYYYILRIHNIVIDENINREYIKILIAHELGHCFLHRGVNVGAVFHETDIFSKYNIDRKEYEANLFAAELPLEDEVIWEELQTSDLTYYQIAQKLGVPVSLMEFKLAMLESKGYMMNNLQTTKADFLKYESAAYDNWYSE